MATGSMPSAAGQLEAEDLPVERQLGVEGAADVGGLAEAVLLALERDVGHRHPPVPQRGHDHLRLRRRDDLVLQPLQHDQRPVEPLQVMDRRALDVHVAPFGVRPDQPVEVPALELVRLQGERLEVGDAVVAGARRERVAGGHRGQGREATRRATADAEAVRVDAALGGQPAGRGLAVLDVGDTPRVAQEVAVGTTEAGGAAVVDVDDGEAPRRPVLHAQPQGGDGGRGRTTVDHDEERRELAGRSDEARVGRRVVEAVGDRTARGREVDGLRHGHEAVRQVELTGRTEHLERRRASETVDAEPDDRGLGRRRRTDEHDLGAVPARPTRST